MAQPIAPTPTLSGEDAEYFLERISKPPSKEEIEFFKKIRERFKDFNPLVED